MGAFLKLLIDLSFPTLGNLIKILKFVKSPPLACTPPPPRHGVYIDRCISVPNQNRHATQSRNHSGFSEIAGPSFPWFFSFGFHFEWIFLGNIFPCLIFFLFLPHLPAPITFPIVRPSSNRCKFKREEKLQRGLPVVSHTITIWKGRSCILLLHQI